MKSISGVIYVQYPFQMWVGVRKGSVGSAATPVTGYRGLGVGWGCRGEGGLPLDESPS